MHAPVEVRHDEAFNRFVAEIDGHLAHADYTLDGARMTFTHTFVPPELRGHGIAEQLVRPALAHARAHNLRVVPTCSYVAAFIARHREFADLLT
ncbi:MAG: GNAT family N-acetyltransferase [Rariglobus sp.]|nr:GNAT family N-acetyltransferase [Rariglobus sp.]